MDLATPHAADAMAAGESELTRVRADLNRAVALLTAKGIPFTATQNPATPWLMPMDNSAALVARDKIEARIAATMDALCGPAAFHRNAAAATAAAVTGARVR